MDSSRSYSGRCDPWANALAAVCDEWRGRVDHWPYTRNTAIPVTQCTRCSFCITKEDFIEEIEGIITVGEFYEMAAGGKIIFT
jgi:hypothetical protein